MGSQGQDLVQTGADLEACWKGGGATSFSDCSVDYRWQGVSTEGECVPSGIEKKKKIRLLIELFGEQSLQ